MSVEAKILGCPWAMHQVFQCPEDYDAYNSEVQALQILQENPETSESARDISRRTLQVMRRCFAQIKSAHEHIHELEGEVEHWKNMAHANGLMTRGSGEVGKA